MAFSVIVVKKIRRNCHSLFLGIRSAAFFFSAISTHAKNNEEESDESDEDSPYSQIPSSTTQQWIDGNPALVNKSLCPAITYWLALTTPNGAPANPIVVHRALLKCGVDVTANKVRIHSLIQPVGQSIILSSLLTILLFKVRIMLKFHKVQRHFRWELDSFPVSQILGPRHQNA